MQMYSLVSAEMSSGASWLLLAALGLLLFVAAPAGAKSQKTGLPYSHCFKSASTQHSIPVVLLQAVVATESDWNPRARSHANAHGLMQIQWPGTAKHLGVRRVSQLYKPCTNIELGARYLRELLDRYDGDERRALAAYNYGPGRIGTEGRIPRGADKYVSTVRRHRAALLGRTTRVQAQSLAETPAGRADPASRSSKGDSAGTVRVATFSSRLRAKRFAKLLRRKVPRGTFAVSRATPGRYELLLTKGINELTADDRVLLTSLGWRL